MNSMSTCEFASISNAVPPFHPSVRPSIAAAKDFNSERRVGFGILKLVFDSERGKEMKTKQQASKQTNKQTNKSANRQTKRGMRSLPSRLLVCWKVVTCRLQECHENRFCNLPLDISKENRHLINCLMSICVILFPFNRTGRWVTSSPPSVSLSLRFCWLATKKTGHVLLVGKQKLKLK